MSENKFILQLKGEQTPKSVIEVKNDKLVAPFTNVPNSTDVVGSIIDVKDSSVVTAKGAQNWKLDGSSLVPATNLAGDGTDYTGEFNASGSTLWFNSTYAFTGPETFNPTTKWVLQLCGKNLLSANGDMIDFTFVVKIGASNIMVKSVKVSKQANFFRKQFVLDFSETAQTPIDVNSGDNLVVQLLCADAGASATIYNGMTVLTLLNPSVINNPEITIRQAGIEKGKFRLNQTEDAVIDLVGDTHNLGWYATPTALNVAHPTATAGDWAIIGSTDTVWVWDTDTSAWVNTSIAGQVTSVNGKTGAVTLAASDVGALPDSTVIPAAQVNSDWNAISGVAEILNKPSLATVATSGAYSDLTGTPTIPTVNDATITITQGGVTKGSFTLNQSSGDTIALDAGGGGSTEIEYATYGTTTYQQISDWLTAGKDVLCIYNGKTYRYGYDSAGHWFVCVNPGAVNLVYVQTNNTWSSSQRLKQDQMQYSTMPTANLSNEGKILQYVGTTNANYTNGYFYVCVNNGGVYSWQQIDVQPDELPSQTGNSGKFLTTNGSSASWSDKPLVNEATPASSLGVGYTTVNTTYTDSVNIGNGAQVLANNALALGAFASAEGQDSIAIYSSTGTAHRARTTHTGNIAIGYNALAINAAYTIAIGYNAFAQSTNAIQLGTGNNASSGTMQVWTHKLLDKTSGLIPSARLADQTSATQGQVLTLDSNLDAVWANAGGGSTEIEYATYGTTTYQQISDWLTAGKDVLCIYNGFTYRYSYNSASTHRFEAILPSQIREIWVATDDSWSYQGTNKQNLFQYSPLPTANASNVGAVYQYIGTTDANYTQGYFYICVDNSGTYSWEPLNVQRPVIAYQAPTAQNNYTWYRKYADGWVEMGGILEKSPTGQGDINHTVNLPVAMADANYTVTTNFTDITTSGNIPWYLLSTKDHTTTSFKIYTGELWGRCWQVSGTAA